MSLQCRVGLHQWGILGLKACCIRCGKLQPALQAAIDRRRQAQFWIPPAPKKKRLWPWMTFVAISLLATTYFMASAGMPGLLFAIWVLLTCTSFITLGWLLHETWDD